MEYCSLPHIITFQKVTWRTRSKLHVGYVYADGSRCISVFADTNKPNPIELQHYDDECVGRRSVMFIYTSVSDAVSERVRAVSGMRCWLLMLLATAECRPTAAVFTRETQLITHPINNLMSLTICKVR